MEMISAHRRSLGIQKTKMASQSISRTYSPESSRLFALQDRFQTPAKVTSYHLEARRTRPSSGMAWPFRNVGMGVLEILEDVGEAFTEFTSAHLNVDTYSEPKVDEFKIYR